MANFVRFKDEMKAWQVKDRAYIKELEKEVEFLCSRFTKITSINKDDFARLFPHLYRVLLNDSKYQSQLSEKSMIPLELDKISKEAVSFVRKLYNLNQNVINAMDNDKIINYIDIERLLMLSTISELPYDYRFEAFKAVVGFDLKYIRTHGIECAENAWYIDLLSEYITISGDLLFNEDITHFKGLLYMILADFQISYVIGEKADIFIEGAANKTENKINALVDAFCNFLMANNVKLKMDAKLNEDKKIESISEEVVKVEMQSREPLESLRKYYKNGVLVEVPEDIETFNNLLDECGLDEKEKRYILGLINIELAKRKENKIVKYLDNLDQELFTKAQDILNGLNHTDGDYYTLIQLLNDLKAAGDMLDEVNSEEEKEELLLEVEVLLSDLRGVLGKYLKEDEVSENNILFLVNEAEVPYLKEDSDNLDGSFYKMICSGIRKIRKDNQSNFRLVMTSDNMPYRTYDILSSKVHLSFIEIDNGIYVLVGADAVNQGYDKIVRRVINNSDEIQRLEALVKNENTRNSILLSHEEYLSLFSAEPNAARKRATE